MIWHCLPSYYLLSLSLCICEMGMTQEAAPVLESGGRPTLDQTKWCCRVALLSLCLWPFFFGGIWSAKPVKVISRFWCSFVGCALTSHALALPFLENQKSKFFQGLKVMKGDWVLSSKGRSTGHP